MEAVDIENFSPFPFFSLVALEEEEEEEEADSAILDDFCPLQFSSFYNHNFLFF